MELTDIVFTLPPSGLKDWYQDLAGAGSELPSYGLCYLAAITRENGYSTLLLDPLALKLTLEETVQRILDHNPRYVGISVNTLTIFKGVELARVIKERDKQVKIIVGGPHITASGIETFERFPSFDVGVVAEGEITIIELLKCLDSKLKFSNIEGIIYRENGQVQKTAQRAFIEDLDSLPFPAWDLLPDLPKYYRPAGNNISRLPATSLVPSRGCPMRCTFCNRSIFGRKFRAHSPEYIMGMIKELYHKYRIRDITFQDDNFMGNPKLKEICQLLIKEKMDLTWSCLGSTNFAKTEILKLMRQAGCWQISWGIETASQEILNVFKKGITVEQMENALKLTHKTGIKNRGFFMIGGFLETKETIKKTIKFIKELPMSEFHITFFTPMPGAEAYELAQQYGTFDKSWEKINVHSSNFIPRALSREELEYYHKKAYRIFYLRPRIIWYFFIKMVKNPKLIPKIGNSLIAFFKFLLRRGCLSPKMSTKLKIHALNRDESLRIS